MDRKTKWRIALMPFALGGLIAPALGACKDNPLDTLCCKEFNPGSDMTAVDWGLEGGAEANFGAFMQATGDLSALAASMATDISAACQNIATDLGEDPATIKE